MVPVKDYYCSPDLYDVIYSDIHSDIPFWVEQARAARGRVLELCCGNGRVLIPCLEAGVPIEGLDNTEAMIESGRARLAARGLERPAAARCGVRALDHRGRIRARAVHGSKRAHARQRVEGLSP